MAVTTTYANALYNHTRYIKMNTGFLGKPAPDDGYNAVLGALAPHAAPAEGTLAGTNPSVHNRVKATFINPVATYPFIARRWSEGWEQMFHPGDLMFIYNGRGSEADDDKSHGEVVQTARYSVLANLPVLNTIIRLGSSPGASKYTQFKNPEDWVFIGVMRNSAAASGLHPQVRAKRGGNAMAPERIINIDVRGSTRMFNYWQGARAGGHLWLCWRQVSMTTTYTPDPMTGKRKRSWEKGDTVKYRHNGRTLKGTIFSIDEEHSTCIIKGKDTDDQHTVRLHHLQDVNHMSYWQLLPHSDDQRASSDYQPVRVWGNDQLIRSRTYKRPICAGWVFQGIGAGEMSDDAVSIRKATQIGEDRFRLPMVHSFLHV